MSRVKRGVTSHARHKKVLRQTKGYRHGRKNLIRRAREGLMKALRYQYRDRKVKKRTFRREWIVVVNAGARANGLTYAQLMNGLKIIKLDLNRKVLAELARTEPEEFKKIAEKARAALKNS